MATKYTLVRELDYCGARFAIFRVDSDSGSDKGGRTPRLDVYRELKDPVGRPYWQEEIDSDVDAGVFEAALLNPAT